MVAPVLQLLDLDKRDVRNRWRLFKPGLLLFMPGMPPAACTLDRLRQLPGVLRVVDLPTSRCLAGCFGGADAAVVPLPGGTVVGRGAPVVIAGPCSVETESQLLQAAIAAKEAGAQALRGGAFKPRTSPYSFGGLEEEGLEYLAKVREATGLPVVTEAMDSQQLDMVARYADVIQIGSRSMHNLPLLFGAGSHPSQKPVLLKRGFGATIDELLGAAEYVLLGRFAADAARPGLILCERGIRSFETATRATLDIAAIPVVKQ